MATKINGRILPYIELTALKTMASILPEALGKQALRREFARKLVDMRGIPMKMAQVLSMSSDQATAALQAEAIATLTPCPSKEIAARLKLNAPQLLEKILQLSDPGIAASLGQVHQAKMRDGRLCALKMKHAGIGSVMDLDANLMEFLVSVFGHFRDGFVTDDYQNLLTQELGWELDYPFESTRQQTLWQAFKDQPQIIIPRPYPLESGNDHLLMDWEPSQTIAQFANTASIEECEQAHSLLAEFHLTTLFNLNLAHADPNPGNFGIRRGSHGVELVVYDYGSVVPIKESRIVGLLGLIQAVRNGNDVYPFLIAMDFLPEPLSAIRNQLPALCHILLEPFTTSQKFTLSDWNRKSRVVELLGAERWNFMVAAPPEMFFVMRALNGLFYYGEKLGGHVNLEKVLIQLFPYSENSVPTLSRVASPSNGGENIEETSTNTTRASHLRVKVEKYGKTVVSITMPSNAIERLDQIMDSETLQTIEVSGIDLDNSINIARNNNFIPMTVFEWNTEDKRIKVWLE
jgi:predicted unusual protein kinase regulating ubiquinone biosynthesis (AarF/ABC1/UbiB family)